MKKLRLLKYFTVFSLIAFLITGTLLVLFIANHMKNDKINETMEYSQLAMYYTIQPELSITETGKAVSKSKIDSLNKKLQLFIEDNNIIEIKVINKARNIIYSNNSDLIGKTIISDKNISDAFRNKQFYVLSNTLDDVNGKNNKLVFVRMYLPIISANDVIGVYEIIMSYDNIRKHIIDVNKRIILIILSGLLMLYLLLIRIVHGASKRLIQQNEELHTKTLELEDSYIKLNSAYKNTVLALSNAVDARDSYTAGHTERVARLSVKIGRLLNLSNEQLINLELAALFHDIGKIGVSDSILNKPGSLTSEEFHKIMDHPSIGVTILKNIDFLEKTLPIILHHHEKFGGGGYPYGLKRDEIPIEARIIAVSDTYDAITSDRPYRKGKSSEYAVAEIKKFKGLQFDEKVVQAFLKAVDQ